MISLTPKIRQQLKAKAHKLKPIVFIGNNGVSENVVNEINRGLEDHELIKIRFHETDRDVRKAMFAEICETTAAHPVQLIGSIGVLYKKSDKED